MSDRDVPSVPVTTLAGLTSLSDLLSELPVSGSVSSTTSLNKSLLFHTLVAEESNNLLSVRDDNLVRQLVHAIEQTNSDQIELKSQYAINQHGTNISEYPELLQGIYTFRPTVFNTPQSHRVQNHQVSNTIPSQSHLHQQQQQKVPVNTISQNQADVIVQQVQLQQSPVTTRQRANAQNVNANPNVQFVAGIDPKQQQGAANLVANSPQNNVVVGHGNVFANTETPSKRPMNRRQIANELQAQQQLVQQQQQQQNQLLQQPQITQQQQLVQQQIPQQIQQQQQQFQLQQPQQKISPQQQHQPLLQQQQQPQQHLQQQNVIQQQQVHYQQQQQQAIIQQQQLLQQQQAHIAQKGGQQPKVVNQQQIPIQQTQSTVLVRQQMPQQLVAQKTSVVQQTPVVQKTVLVQQSPTAQKTSVVQKTPTPQKASIIQPTNAVQQTPVKQQNAQRQQQPNQILQQSPQQQSPQQNQQQSPQQLRQPPQVLMQQAQLMQQQQFMQQQQQQQPIQPPIQQQKTIPRNNEYLEQQSKNFDLRGPSPAQASVAPDSNQIGTPRQLSQAQKPNLHPTDSKDKFSNSTEIPVLARRDSGSLGLTPKVCLNRLKAEDEELMQKSIKKFVKKSPELARKLGIVEVASPIKMDIDPVIVPAAPVAAPAPAAMPAPIVKDEKPKEEINQEIKMETNDIKDIKDKAIKKVDTFSQMKADERKTAPKRKLQPIDEIPPEQIFSQPKLRRVERIVAPVVPKTSKEEIMKSQTYQQFMKNMEQIIEQLDDTEPPNFTSEETDENVECISSKMLTVVSNDVAKLKAKGVLDSIPKNKLTLLINYAMRNVYLARNYSAGPDVEEEIIGEDTMEKILNAIEACLLICNIYSTAKDLKFLQEDNISLIIKFVQFQFRETIFPSYDPVYIVKNMKKVDNRKKKAAQNHNRSLQLLYSKCVQLMKVFVTLFDKCLFVDTIVLALSTLAIEPFFVDNIETLQFVCLELVTTIFRKEQYVKMRSSILTDILASIDRLPCSKKNLRPFKLANNGGNIQMVTALVLQLIQCATVLPENICETKNGRPGKKSKPIPPPEPVDDQSGNNKKMPPEKDLIVIEKYDTAVSIGGNFLTTFLSKCKTRSNETDFRPLFENFIHDLLTTVNKPEWPAAELLLSLLGTLLVKYMSDKTIEQSIRLSSLDYLGIVAARLRKDTVESRCKVNIMDQMIKCIKAEQEKEGDLPNKNSNIVLDPDEERTEFLQKILLDFLAVNAQEENLIWDYARHFYLTQWYRDIMQQRKRIAEGEKGYASRKKKTAKKKRRKGESSESSSDEDKDKSDDDDVPLKKSKDDTPDQELNLEIFQVLDERKKFLLSKIKPYSDMNCASHHIKTYIDYNNAHLIAQYLATKRPFSQSFDKYLQKIILLVREPSIAIRTRAMKCLSTIVDVDPLILSRKDMQMGVKQKFFDNAISVREAAVDLVGKYVLTSEELIDQYYEMLITRILDTGVSVRKRVIKILRDICIEYPDFPKIPEICVKMIRRVHDEEGIQKLVTEVFMRMWFTPCKDNDKHSVQRKINQIIDVVNTAHDNTGTLWLDGLLNSIFTPKDNNPKLELTSENVKKNTEPPPEVVLACQQLADGLVERLIEEELEDTNNTRMVGCITTMHLLAKVRPQLLVRHAITIEPYLNIKCHLTNAPKFICSVAEILEQVVPLMEHPSDTFLADLEEHLMMRVVSLNQTVVLSCLSCLGAVVNKITKNYKLIKDCFVKFYRSIINSREQLANNPNLPIDNIYQPIFRRSLYTIGILMRYFDFKSPKIIGLEEGEKISSTICDEVFDSLVYFITCPNYEIRKQALISLGHFCVQNDEYLTRPALRDFYRDLLTSTTVEANIKLVCLRNIWMYLTESEMYMHNKEKDWQTQSQTEDLKEMNDVMSGMASRIIQLYLTEILDCFLHSDCTVRLFAVKVIQIVLRQGLVHPVRMVPFLICLSTDGKQEIAHRADALLKDIDKTYAGFVNMKLQLGLQLSFQLQELLQAQEKGDSSVIRGYCKRDNQPISLNDFLYTLLRNTKPQRRALVQTVTKQFDDQKTTLRQMLYLADNLAYFSYQVQDEPLYLIHQIDIMISVTGTNLLAAFKEGLKPEEVVDNNKENPLEDDDDEEDKDAIFNRLPDDTTELQKCITSAQGCMLLLILKQHLKDMYGITDGKISRYSPSEPQKIYEKAVTRKQVPDFNPKSTIEVIRRANIINKELDEKEKRSLIEKYLDFKQLMLRLDPDDLDSQDEDKPKINNSLTGSTPRTPATNTSTTDTPVKTDDTATPHVNNVNNSVSTPVQQKMVSTTPTSRNQKSSKSVTTRKQPARSKRKKRKIISSDEEESDYNSDSDYA